MDRLQREPVPPPGDCERRSRPNLGRAGETGGVEASADTLVAALDAQAPAGTTPGQIEDGLKQAAEAVGVKLSDDSVTAEVVQDEGPAYRVNLEATGKTEDLVAFVDGLSRRVRREGAQVKSEGGPLYLVVSLDLTTAASVDQSVLRLTLLVPGQEG